MAKNITAVAGKGISLVCVEDHENSTPRMHSTLDAKEVDQRQDNTAEPGTTAT